MLQTVLAVVQPNPSCSDANASLVHCLTPFALAFHSHRAASVFAHCVFFHIFYQYNEFNFSLSYTMLTVAIILIFSARTYLYWVLRREKEPQAPFQRYMKNPHSLVTSALFNMILQFGLQLPKGSAGSYALLSVLS